MGMPYPLRREEFLGFRAIEEMANSFNVKAVLRTTRPPKDSTASTMPFLSLSVAGVDASLMADAEVAIRAKLLMRHALKGRHLARRVHGQV